MADDGAPKSAVELAMERLRKKDAAEGITPQTLTDAQKLAIADVRSLYDSKIAEQDILQQSAMNSRLGAGPDELDEIGRQFRRERERLATERDARIEKLRRGDGGR